MRQLVQLTPLADQFKSLSAEVIVVFREEGDGVEGLKKVLKTTKTPFTLALDKDKKSSRAYSEKRMTFDNYVIEKSGTVKAIIPGTLRDRAKANELIKHLKEIEEK